MNSQKSDDQIVDGIDLRIPTRFQLGIKSERHGLIEMFVCWDLVAPC